MARALRVEYSGAVHHVTSRGNERRNIFRSDADRRMFLEFLAAATRRFGWLVTAWVLMSNHFHLVIETPMENLSQGMQWLNGEYAQWFNKKYGRSGHLFQGRFKSFLIEKESYLREVIRYVVLNPVRAKMVQRPEDYRWSSYRATAGFEKAPPWLALDSIAGYFGETDTWQANYRDFVAEKIDSTECLWDQLMNQIYLGGERWAASIRARVESKPRSDAYPAIQRSVGRPKMHRIVHAVARAFGMPIEAIRHGHGGLARMVTAWLGWWEGLARLSSIAASLRLASCGRVSDLVSDCERALFRNRDLQSIVDTAFAELRA